MEGEREITDVSLIEDEDFLRRMWQQTEDRERKKEIRSRLYEIRERRLKEFHTTGEFSSDPQRAAILSQSFELEPFEPSEIARNSSTPAANTAKEMSRSEAFDESDFMTTNPHEMFDSGSTGRNQLAQSNKGSDSHSTWKVESASESYHAVGVDGQFHVTSQAQGRKMAGENDKVVADSSYSTGNQALIDRNGDVVMNSRMLDNTGRDGSLLGPRAGEIEWMGNFPQRKDFDSRFDDFNDRNLALMENVNGGQMVSTTSGSRSSSTKMSSSSSFVQKSSVQTQKWSSSTKTSSSETASSRSMVRDSVDRDDGQYDSFGNVRAGDDFFNVDKFHDADGRAVTRYSDSGTEISKRGMSEVKKTIIRGGKVITETVANVDGKPVDGSVAKMIPGRDKKDSPDETVTVIRGGKLIKESVSSKVDDEKTRVVSEKQNRYTANDSKSSVETFITTERDSTGRRPDGDDDEMGRPVDPKGRPSPNDEQFEPRGQNKPPPKTKTIIRGGKVIKENIPSDVELTDELIRQESGHTQKTNIQKHSSVSRTSTSSVTSTTKKSQVTDEQNKRQLINDDFENTPNYQDPDYDPTRDEQPGYEQPGKQPADGKPRKPGSDRPGSDRPGSERPGSDRPGSGRPGSDRPGSGRPGSDRPDDEDIEKRRFTDSKQSSTKIITVVRDGKVTSHDSVTSVDNQVRDDRKPSSRMPYEDDDDDDLNRNRPRLQPATTKNDSSRGSPKKSKPVDKTHPNAEPDDETRVHHEEHVKTVTVIRGGKLIKETVPLTPEELETYERDNQRPKGTPKGTSPNDKSRKPGVKPSGGKPGDEEPEDYDRGTPQRPKKDQPSQQQPRDDRPDDDNAEPEKYTSVNDRTDSKRFSSTHHSSQMRTVTVIRGGKVIKEKVPITDEDDETENFDKNKRKPIDSTSKIPKRKEPKRPDDDDAKGGRKPNKVSPEREKRQPSSYPEDTYPTSDIPSDRDGSGYPSGSEAPDAVEKIPCRIVQVIRGGKLVKDYIPLTKEELDTVEPDGYLKRPKDVSRKTHPSPDSGKPGKQTPTTGKGKPTDRDSRPRDGRESSPTAPRDGYPSDDSFKPTKPRGGRKPDGERPSAKDYPEMPEEDSPNREYPSGSEAPDAVEKIPCRIVQVIRGGKLVKDYIPLTKEELDTVEPDGYLERPKDASRKTHPSPDSGKPDKQTPTIGKGKLTDKDLRPRDGRESSPTAPRDGYQGDDSLKPTKPKGGRKPDGDKPSAKDYPEMPEEDSPKKGTKKPQKMTSPDKRQPGKMNEKPVESDDDERPVKTVTVMRGGKIIKETVQMTDEEIRERELMNIRPNKEGKPTQDFVKHEIDHQTSQPTKPKPTDQGKKPDQGSSPTAKRKPEKETTSTVKTIIRGGKIIKETVPDTDDEPERKSKFPSSEYPENDQPNEFGRRPQDGRPGQPDRTTPGKHGRRPEDDQPDEYGRRPQDGKPGQPDRTTPDKYGRRPGDDHPDEYGRRPQDRRPGEPDHTTPDKHGRRPGDDQPDEYGRRPQDGKPGQPDPTTPDKHGKRPGDDQPDEYGRRPQDGKPGQPDPTTPDKYGKRPGDDQPDEYGRRPQDRRPGEPDRTTPDKYGRRPGDDQPDEYGRRPQDGKPGQPDRTTPDKYGRRPGDDQPDEYGRRPQDCRPGEPDGTAPDKYGRRPGDDQPDEYGRRPQDGRPGQPDRTTPDKHGRRPGDDQPDEYSRRPQDRRLGEPDGTAPDKYGRRPGDDQPDEYGRHPQDRRPGEPDGTTPDKHGRRPGDDQPDEYSRRPQDRRPGEPDRTTPDKQGRRPDDKHRNLSPDKLDKTPRDRSPISSSRRPRDGRPDSRSSDKFSPRDRHAPDNKSPGDHRPGSLTRSPVRREPNKVPKSKAPTSVSKPRKPSDKTNRDELTKLYTSDKISVDVSASHAQFASSLRAPPLHHDRPETPSKSLTDDHHYPKITSARSPTPKHPDKTIKDSTPNARKKLPHPEYHYSGKVTQTPKVPHRKYEPHSYLSPRKPGRPDSPERPTSKQSSRINDVVSRLTSDTKSSRERRRLTSTSTISTGTITKRTGIRPSSGSTKPRSKPDHLRKRTTSTGSSSTAPTEPDSDFNFQHPHGEEFTDDIRKYEQNFIQTERVHSRQVQKIIQNGEDFPVDHKRRPIHKLGEKSPSDESLTHDTDEKYPGTGRKPKGSIMPKKPGDESLPNDDDDFSRPQGKRPKEPKDSSRPRREDFSPSRKPTSAPFGRPKSPGSERSRSPSRKNKSPHYDGHSPRSIHGSPYTSPERKFSSPDRSPDRRGKPKSPEKLTPGQRGVPERPKKSTLDYPGQMKSPTKENVPVGTNKGTPKKPSGTTKPVDQFGRPTGKQPDHLRTKPDGARPDANKPRGSPLNKLHDQPKTTKTPGSHQPEKAKPKPGEPSRPTKTPGRKETDERAPNKNRKPTDFDGEDDYSVTSRLRSTVETKNFINTEIRSETDKRRQTKKNIMDFDWNEDTPPGDFLVDTSSVSSVEKIAPHNKSPAADSKTPRDKSLLGRDGRSSPSPYSTRPDLKRPDKTHPGSPERLSSQPRDGDHPKRKPLEEYPSQNKPGKSEPSRKHPRRLGESADTSENDSEAEFPTDDDFVNGERKPRRVNDDTYREQTDLITSEQNTYSTKVTTSARQDSVETTGRVEMPRSRESSKSPSPSRNRLNCVQVNERDTEELRPRYADEVTEPEDSDDDSPKKYRRQPSKRPQKAIQDEEPRKTLKDMLVKKAFEKIGKIGDVDDVTDETLKLTVAERVNKFMETTLKPGDRPKSKPEDMPLQGLDDSINEYRQKNDFEDDVTDDQQKRKPTSVIAAKTMFETIANQTVVTGTARREIEREDDILNRPSVLRPKSPIDHHSSPGSTSRKPRDVSPGHPDGRYSSPESRRKPTDRDDSPSRPGHRRTSPGSTTRRPTDRDDSPSRPGHRRSSPGSTTRRPTDRDDSPSRPGHRRSSPGSTSRRPRDVSPGHPDGRYSSPESSRKPTDRNVSPRRPSDRQYSPGSTGRTPTDRDGSPRRPGDHHSSPISTSRRPTDKHVSPKRPGDRHPSSVSPTRKPGDKGVSPRRPGDRHSSPVSSTKKPGTRDVSPRRPGDRHSSPVSSTKKPGTRDVSPRRPGDRHSSPVSSTRRPGDREVSPRHPGDRYSSPISTSKRPTDRDVSPRRPGESPERYRTSPKTPSEKPKENVHERKPRQPKDLYGSPTRKSPGDDKYSPTRPGHKTSSDSSPDRYGSTPRRSTTRETSPKSRSEYPDDKKPTSRKPTDRPGAVDRYGSVPESATKRPSDYSPRRPAETSPDRDSHPKDKASYLSPLYSKSKPTGRDASPAPKTKPGSAFPGLDYPEPKKYDTPSRYTSESPDLYGTYPKRTGQKPTGADTEPKDKDYYPSLLSEKKPDGLDRPGRYDLFRLENRPYSPGFLDRNPDESKPRYSPDRYDSMYPDHPSRGESPTARLLARLDSPGHMPTKKSPSQELADQIRGISPRGDVPRTVSKPETDRYPYSKPSKDRSSDVSDRYTSMNYDRKTSSTTSMTTTSRTVGKYLGSSLTPERRSPSKQTRSPFDREPRTTGSSFPEDGYSSPSFEKAKKIPENSSLRAPALLKKQRQPDDRKYPGSGHRPVYDDDDDEPRTTPGKRTPMTKTTKSSLLSSTDSKVSKFGVSLKKTTSGTSFPKRGPVDAGKKETELDRTYDLDVLNSMLERATGYEDRRLIRGQIRIVKTMIENNELPQRQPKSSRPRHEDYDSHRPTSKTQPRDHDDSISSRYSNYREETTSSQTTITRSSPERGVRPRETSPGKYPSVTSTLSPRHDGPSKRYPSPFSDGKSPEKTYGRKPQYGSEPGRPGVKKYSPDRGAPGGTLVDSETRKHLFRPDSPKKGLPRYPYGEEELYPGRSAFGVSKTIKETKESNITDSIISSYGVGPTDDKGRPLFGLQALRRQKGKPEAETDDPLPKAAPESPVDIRDSSGRAFFGLKALRAPKKDSDRPESPSLKDPLVPEPDGYSIDSPSQHPRRESPLSREDHDEEFIGREVDSTEVSRIMGESGQSLKDMIRKHERYMDDDHKGTDKKSSSYSTSTVVRSTAVRRPDGTVSVKKDVVRGVTTAKDDEEPRTRVTSEHYSYETPDRVPIDNDDEKSYLRRTGKSVTSRSSTVDSLQEGYRRNAITSSTGKSLSPDRYSTSPSANRPSSRTPISGTSDLTSGYSRRRDDTEYQSSTTSRKSISDRLTQLSKKFSNDSLDKIPDYREPKSDTHVSSYTSRTSSTYRTSVDGNVSPLADTHRYTPENGIHDRKYSPSLRDDDTGYRRGSSTPIDDVKETLYRKFSGSEDVEHVSMPPAYTRIGKGGSVKALSQKFQQAAAEAETPKSGVSSYPKAGLILRSTSFKHTNGELTSPDSSGYKHSASMEVRVGSPTRTGINTPKIDYSNDRNWSPSQRDRTSGRLDDVCERRTVTSSTTEIRSDRGKSFLGNSSKVTGVQDIISRMRAADQDIDAEGSVNDSEARSLLNKFLGASVMMSGMEPLVKSSGATSSTLVSQFERQRILDSPNSRGGYKEFDFDNIDDVWDEKRLRQLLDDCTDYEERRKLRARLRTAMAEKSACEDLIADSRDDSDSLLGDSSKSVHHDSLMTSRSDGGSSSTSRVTSKTTYTSSTISSTNKPISPFAKFQQLDRQNSGSAPSSPSVRNAPLFTFTDPKLQRSASGAKDRLLQWCQSKTKEYKNIQIENFSTSWSNGLAFCALIHHFRPEAFDYDSLSPKERRKNFELAFRVAEEEANIAPLLDVEDMVMMKKPDWKCVFTYVQSIFHRFKNEEI